jgi:LysM repeat protein
MRIINKYKFIRSMSILVFLVVAIFNISIATSNKTKTISYIVSKGDTLWTIAGEYKADNKDIRQYIYELKQLNNMTNSNIYEGQELKIIKEQ